MPCGNDVATKWNLVGVEYMERYLQGDRKSSDPNEDLMNQNLDKAINFFIKAIASDSSCARAHINLALTYAEKNQLESARHHASTATKLKPDEARFYAILSVIYELSGLEDLRVASLKQAEELDKYISERKYFGILVSNLPDMTRYRRLPLINQVSIVAERAVARKFLLWIEFASVSIADHSLLEPGASDGFVEKKYIVLRNILPPFLLREIQNCYNIGLKTGRIELTFAQAPRYVTQNDRVGSYFNGSYLNPHSHRPQC